MKTIFNPGTKKKTLTLVDNVVYSTVKDLNGDPLELKLSVLLQNGNSEMRAAMGEDDPKEDHIPKPALVWVPGGGCSKGNGCVFRDDCVNEFVEKAKEADGFVFGTPVYYAHPSGRIMSFLDRAFYSGGAAFRFKPGMAVASARRAGTTASLDAINKYFGINQMPTVGSTYWNMVHGNCPEEVRQDLEGLQTMRNAAKCMAWMLKCFEAGKAQNIALPDTKRKFLLILSGKLLYFRKGDFDAGILCTL